ncbi:hypothetical protein RRF57_012909 [Xylaria bambusicola]|uniref:SnoaL-like domain-containing protein n=1 Tax=Xylaria bambusicola TaxID=326684 RepID=A0AAN7UW08_9PEZI
MTDQIFADLQRRVRNLEDKDAISTLLSQYCKHADNHRWEGYANCFLEDGVAKFENGADVVGRASISAQTSSMGNRFQGLLHSLTNIDLIIDGDKATGSCYLWFAAIADTSRPYEYTGFGGPYEFTFQRTDVGWKIATVHLRRLWAQNLSGEGVLGG